MTFPRLRLAALATVAAALLLALPGCLEMDQKIKIEASGKGTANVKVVVDQAKMNELQEMMKQMGGGAQEQSDPAEEMSPESLRKMVKGNEKVRLVEASSSVDEETQKMTSSFKVEFDSLKDFFESGLASGSSVKLEKLADGNYRFTSKMGGNQMPDDEASVEQMKAMMMPMLEPYMSGFKTGISIELPTAIIETNGKKSGDRAVAYSVDFNGLFDAKNHKQTIVFSGEGLDWEPFSVSADAMKKIRSEALSDDAEEEEAEATPSEPATPAPTR